MPGRGCSASSRRSRYSPPRCCPRSALSTCSGTRASSNGCCSARRSMVRSASSWARCSGPSRTRSSSSPRRWRFRTRVCMRRQKRCGRSPRRTFWTVTIPGARYGLISAVFVVFTLLITDFGGAEGHRGQVQRARDRHLQAGGRRSKFPDGRGGRLDPAVARGVGLRRRSASCSDASWRCSPRAPYRMRPGPTPRSIARCWRSARLIAFAIAGRSRRVASSPRSRRSGLQSDAQLQELRLRHDGWRRLAQLLQLTRHGRPHRTVRDSVVIFAGALSHREDPALSHRLAVSCSFSPLLPLAVPGLVLGLGYIFFFNNPANPLNFIYGTMAILVICTISLYFRLAPDRGDRRSSRSTRNSRPFRHRSRVPFWRTFMRGDLAGLPAVPCWILPCYLFVNAMTTTSPRWSSSTRRTRHLLAIAVLNMDDAGDVAPAAAMAMVVFATSAVTGVIIRVTHAGLSCARRCGEAVSVSETNSIWPLSGRHLRSRPCACGRAPGLAGRGHRARCEGERRLDPQFRLRHRHRAAARQCWQRAMRSRQVWAEVAPARHQDRACRTGGHGATDRKRWPCSRRSRTTEMGEGCELLQPG